MQLTLNVQVKMVKMYTVIIFMRTTFTIYAGFEMKKASTSIG